MRKIAVRTLAVVAATSLIVPLAACSGESGQTSGTATETTAAAAQGDAAAAVNSVEPVGIPLQDDPAAPGHMTVDGDQVTINDMKGHPFTFTPGEVRNVVNLWPASNAAMIALGASDFFAGRIDLGGVNGAWQEHISPAFAEAPALPLKPAPNAEQLLAMNPDLVIQSEIGEDYTNAGLPGISLYFSTYDEMKVAFWILGTILGPEYQQKAVDWAALVDGNIRRVSDGLADTEDRPLVYYMDAQHDTGLDGTFPSPSIINQWVEAAGGRYWVTEEQDKGADALGDGPVKTAPKVNMEAVLADQPDKIVVGGRNARTIADELDNEPGAWAPVTDEIGDDNVALAPNGLFSWDRFGAESALQILWAAAFIHPEVFADPDSENYIDLVAETQKFYRDFVGYDLSEAEAKAMLDNQTPPAAD